jgi:glutamate N-acetyltransferase/amino-acid N-acetyltransferase
MSVTVPRGFVAAGIAAGVKVNGDPDLSLVATADAGAVAAAATFTSNKLAAGPVQVSRAHLAATGGHAAAVVLNSGNANAANGAAGVEHAERMCATTAAALGCPADDVLVCSTGLIGIPFPIEVVEAGVPALVAARSPEGGADAARAIMTTDTVAKEVLVVRPSFSVGGMAKGAAMLAPNMATMLAVLTTDAAAEPAALQAALQEAVNRSFNRLVSDGCTSTNDTVIVLASGLAGPVDKGELAATLEEACFGLASQMVGDAEGATKVVRVEVVGAASDDDADRGARAIARSQLTKCSWFGEDPYWGRVASDLGSADIAFDLDRFSIAYGGIVVAAKGIALQHDAGALAAHMQQRHLRVTADLGLGDGEAFVLSNDLTYGYIDENKGTS